MPQYFIFTEVPQPVERRWIIEAESMEEAEARMEKILTTDAAGLTDEEREGVMFTGWDDAQTMGDPNDPVGNMEEAGEYDNIEDAGEDNGIIDYDFSEDDPDHIDEEE